MNRRATDVAKGFAIVMMLWHHAFYSQSTVSKRAGDLLVSYAPLSSNTVFAMAGACKACVPVFVFITGYGTYRSLTNWRRKNPDSSLGSYSITRHIRLLMQFFPIYVLGVAACCLTGTRTLSAVYGGNGLIKGCFSLVADLLGIAYLLKTPTFIATWWYLSLAILLIYLVPIVVLQSEKYDSITILMIVCMALPLLGVDMGGTFGRYVPTAVFGVFCAQHRIFERVSSAQATLAYRLLALPGVPFVLFCLSLYVERRIGYPWIVQSFAALFLCATAIQLERLGGAVFAFLGKHSSNMFMAHTFLLSVLLPRQIYSLGNWLLILSAITGVTLIASVVLELLKDCVGYRTWCERLISAAQLKLVLQ